MKLKIFILIILTSVLFSHYCSASSPMTELMKAADYQKHKKQAAVISQYFSDVNFSINAENIIKNKKPYLQQDTIHTVKLWEAEIKAFL